MGATCLNVVDPFSHTTPHCRATFSRGRDEVEEMPLSVEIRPECDANFGEVRSEHVVKFLIEMVQIDFVHYCDAI